MSDFLKFWKISLNNSTLKLSEISPSPLSPTLNGRVTPYQTFSGPGGGGIVESLVMLTNKKIMWVKFHPGTLS